MNNEYLDRYRTLGLNIAYFRKKKGFTQEQLAEKAGVERSRISKTEIAWVGTSLDIVYRIADALEVEPYKLFMEREYSRRCVSYQVRAFFFFHGTGRSFSCTAAPQSLMDVVPCLGGYSNIAVRPGDRTLPKPSCLCRARHP